MKRTALLLFSLTLAVTSAHAIPKLQLDIEGGTYNSLTQSISVTADTFNLYALIDVSAPPSPYFLSAGLAYANGDGTFSPVEKTPIPSLGSFTFAGVTVSAASGMTWGKPFLMPPHGTFDTYYSEFKFDLSSTAPTATAPMIGIAPTEFGKFHNYDSQIDPQAHQHITHDPTGASSYARFAVDISGLDDGAALLFDFYTYTASGKKLKIVKAPFSHNAEGGGGETVPDGGHTLVFLGVAITLGEFLRRRVTRK